MYKNLTETLQRIIADQTLSGERKNLLQPLIAIVQQKVKDGQDINLNFICTHNARRSHFAQVWAQAAGAYFNIPNMRCLLYGYFLPSRYRLILMMYPPLAKVDYSLLPNASKDKKAIGVSLFLYS